MNVSKQIMLGLVLLAASWFAVLIGWLRYGLVAFVDAVLAGIEDDIL